MEQPSGALDPLVSCVIIFFNAERYIAEAMASVENQTYHNWEIILVDDGSTDDSRAIVDEFASRHPERARVLEHPGRVNLGKSISRNLGFSTARGQYIAMLDADDAWMPTKLTEQVRVLQNHPEADMLYGRVEFWYSWTGRPRDALRQYTPPLGLRPGVTYNPPFLLEKLLFTTARRAEDMTPYPSAVIFRREVFEETGGFDPDFRILYDDVVFFVKVFLKHRIHVSDQVWAQYRVSPDHTYSPSYEAAEAAGEWSATGCSLPEKMLLERTELYVRRSPATTIKLRIALLLALLRYRRPLVYNVWQGFRRIKYLVTRPAAFIFHTWKTRAHRLPPRVGRLNWGDLSRERPLATHEGSRGQALDRYFAREFCRQQAAVITGDVLEFGDNAQSNRFGTAIRSTHIFQVDELDALMADQHSVASQSYDCVIAIDMIQYSNDARQFLQRLRAQARPGGSVIVSFPGMMPSITGHNDRWRFTEDGVRFLLSEAFPGDDIEIIPYGNTAAAVGMQLGLGVLDLGPKLLSPSFGQNAVLLMARVTKRRI